MFRRAWVGGRVIREGFHFKPMRGGAMPAELHKLFHLYGIQVERNPAAQPKP